MAQKKLLNPRGYLSWTQIDMWSCNPERYVRQYMLGGPEMRSSNMDFGSKVALAEETGEESDDEIVNMLVTLLPKYPKHEYEIKVPLNTAYGEVTLLGKLDKFHDKTLAFRDTKTGITKWTQAKAEKHKQLDHYAALIYLKHGRIPKDIHIDWAETAYYNDRVVLAGGIKTFKVKKTMRDVLEYLVTATRVAVEIDARYRQELAKLT